MILWSALLKKGRSLQVICVDDAQSEGVSGRSAESVMRFSRSEELLKASADELVKRRMSPVRNSCGPWGDLLWPISPQLCGAHYGSFPRCHGSLTSQSNS